MHSVSSNAVAEAIGGSQIRSYEFTVPINTSAGSGYAYTGGIPSEIIMDGTKCNVIGFSAWWGNIGDSRGLQLHLTNISGNTAYINYIKYQTMDTSVTAKCKIYYIV